jgi:hypothetical protein
VDVHATIVATDNLDPSPTVTLVSVTSNEPDDARVGADGQHEERHRHRRRRHLPASSGADRDRERAHLHDHDRATDECGNVTTRSATVTVPVRSQDR